MENMVQNSSISITDVITSAIKLPGVKVTRDVFLRECFKNTTEEVLNNIIEYGPVKAGCAREELRKLANKLIQERTVLSQEHLLRQEFRVVLLWLLQFQQICYSFMVWL